MKKIQILAVSVLSVCLFSAVFTACDKKTDNSETTETSSNIISNTVESSQSVSFSMGADGYKYYIYESDNTETENVGQQVTNHTLLTFTKKAETTKKTETQTAKPTKKDETTVKSNVYDETVKSESKGISVLTKTTPVKKGNTATIAILGQAGKSYSIEFYKNASSVAASAGLSSKTADENGMAVWTFDIGYDCETGNRKIIIRENGSDNFVQTSITIE